MSPVSMSDGVSGTSQQFGYDQFGTRTIGVNGGGSWSNLLTYNAAGIQLSSSCQLLQQWGCSSGDRSGCPDFPQYDFPDDAEARHAA